MRLDDIIDRISDVYARGPMNPSKFRTTVARFEAALLKDIPAAIVLHADPSDTPTIPERAIMLTKPLDASSGRDRQLTVQWHSIVMRTSRWYFVSGLAPACAIPHLFDRVVERNASKVDATSICLGLTAVWPTMALVRGEQLLAGVGKPLGAIVVPFGDGLMLGKLERLDGMPATGLVAVSGNMGFIRFGHPADWYSSGKSRLNAEMKTFVEGGQLSERQIRLRDQLNAFADEHADVVADDQWRWRIGLGADDPCVAAVASAFGLVPATSMRRSAAYAHLDGIMLSKDWTDEAKSNFSKNR